MTRKFLRNAPVATALYPILRLELFNVLYFSALSCISMAELSNKAISINGCSVKNVDIYWRSAEHFGIVSVETKVDTQHHSDKTFEVYKCPTA